MAFEGEHPMANGAGLENGTSYRQEPIAIVGIGCRFPGQSDSPSALWDLLSNGQSAQSRIPADRFNINGFYHPKQGRPGSLSVQGGYFIGEDVRNFDPSFFGLRPVEATSLDPQVRKLLEVTYECMESAGVTLEQISGSKTAVYMASFTDDFRDMQLREPEFLLDYKVTGSGDTMLSNRISYTFNLKGPSMTIDTACSGSMYALHTACNALQNGECTAAMVGGANVIISPEKMTDINFANMLSKSGHCQTFDIAADGYARAEGVGVLYVKRLSDAVRDGDPIRGVVRGTAVNANGRTGGISHPSREGQRAVIQEAYRRAGLDPRETSYVECHGTGTGVGDPLEVSAIADVFTLASKREEPLLIGSVKTNCGHTEPTSAVLGIVKTLMGMEKGVIPATIGVRTLTPKINWKDWNVKVPTESTPWPAGSIRRASVNSFGYGGANGHCIIESAESMIPGYSQLVRKWTVKDEPTDIVPLTSGLKFLLPISAHSENVLNLTTRKLAQVADSYNIEDLAYTLSRKSSLYYRAFTIGQTGNAREAFLGDSVVKGRKPKQTPRIAFICTGQGAQWPQMGKELILHYPSFYKTIQQLDNVLQNIQEYAPSWTIEEALTTASVDINNASISQPLCTAVQIAIIKLLASWNIFPVATAGHSSGEIAAAFAAGRLTDTEAMVLAYIRGVAVGKASTGGSMLAVGLGQEGVAPYLKGSAVTVACVNSPASVTLSGMNEDLDLVEAALKKDSVFARRLKTGGKAYHSAHMKFVGDFYEEVTTNILQTLPISGELQPECPMRSTVTTEYVNGRLDGVSYWRRNLENPVLFSQGVTEMLRDPELNIDHLIEIGPHAALAGPVRQIKEELKLPPSRSEVGYLSTLQRGTDSVDNLLGLAGRLFLLNYPLDLARVNAVEVPTKSGATKLHYGKFIVDFPKYQWDYSTLYWASNRYSNEWKYRKHVRHDVLGSKIPGTTQNPKIWKNILRLKDLPWLEDHKIGTQIVFPAAGYIAMAIEAITQVFDDRKSEFVMKMLAGQNSSKKGQILNVDCYELRDVNIKGALSLSPDEDTEVLLTLSSFQWTINAASDSIFEFSVTSCSGGVWSDNATGVIQVHEKQDHDLKTFPDVKLWRTARDHKCYDALQNVGLNYGPCFQPLSEIHVDPSQKLAKATTALNPAAKVMDNESRYAIHPATLDGCLQLSLIATFARELKNVQKGYLPVFAEKILVWPRDVWEDSDAGSAIASGKITGLRSVTIDSELRGSSGKPLLSIQNFRCVSIEGGLQADSSTPVVPYYRMHWKPDYTFLKQEQLSKMYPSAGETSEGQVSNMIDLLVHKYPEMKILDASGDGALTAAVTSTLGATSPFHRYSSYVCIGASDETKDALKACRDVKFASLDLEKDLREQGFQSDFDLVISSNISDCSKLKALLNPQGKALLVQTIDATSPKPDTALTQSGFSGVDLSLEAEAADGQTTSIILTRPTHGHSNGHTNGHTNGHSADPELYIVSRDDRTPSEDIITSAINTLANKDCYVTQHVSLTDLVQNCPIGATYLFLTDVDRPMLVNLQKDELAALQMVCQSSSKVFWVTAGGLYTGQVPDYAMTSGLAKVMRTETPSLSLYTLDVTPADRTPEEMAAFVWNVFSKTEGSESRDYDMREDGGVVYVERMAPDDALNKVASADDEEMQNIEFQSKKSLRMEIATVGQFDTLYFKDDVRVEQDSLEPGMVRIKTEAVGMNMKDVVNLMGQIDQNFLSFEAAGTVDKIGPGVTRVRPGDKVVCIGEGTFGTHMWTHEACCVRVERDCSIIEAATLPATYLTAIYCLLHMGRLRQGESILISAAAGGVGVAAIQIAHMVGAEVYATVGSKSKRDFLRENFGIPEDHMFNSRDASFHKDVLKATGGRGVDVVLNSTTNELLHASVASLAPFGRHVELGIRDILDRGKLNMKLLDGSRTFSGFYLGDLAKSPRDMAALMDEMMELFRTRKIHPVRPITVYHISELQQAMRHFMEGTHVAKVIIDYSPKPGATVKYQPSPRVFKLKPDVSYVLVGCLGGIGRSLSLWLLDHGARNFIYLSRSGTDAPKAAALVHDLQRCGANVTVVRGDASNFDDVDRAVRESKLPVGGVINAAVVLRDTFFSKMTIEDWEVCTHAKVLGTKNLHRALEENRQKPDFFVGTASVSGVVGVNAQGNYSAANSFLDSFARHRRSKGLAATSVDLGVITEVGLVSENASMESYLYRNGFYGIPEDEMLAALEMGMDASLADRDLDDAQLVTGFDPYKLKAIESSGEYEINRVWKDDIRLAAVSTALSGSGESYVDRNKMKLIDLVKNAEAEEGYSLLREKIAEKLAVILTIPVDQIDETKPVSAYGMDSMLAAELRGWVFKEAALEIPLLEILGPAFTPKKLADDIYKTVKA